MDKALIQYSADMPPQISAGEDFLVTISIKTNNIAGKPLTIMQTLPEGFTTAQNKNGGAEFEANGSQVIFKWDKFPSQKYTAKYQHRRCIRC